MSHNFLKNLFGSKKKKTKPKTSILNKRDDLEFKKQHNSKYSVEDDDVHKKQVEDLNNIHLPSKLFYKKLDPSSNKKEAISQMNKFIGSKGISNL